MGGDIPLAAEDDGLMTGYRATRHHLIPPLTCTYTLLSLKDDGLTGWKPKRLQVVPLRSVGPGSTNPSTRQPVNPSSPRRACCG